MKVRDGMTTLVLTIGPAHTLREAARLMSSRRVGAAVVIDPEHSGVGILERPDQGRKNRRIARPDIAQGECGLLAHLGVRVAQGRGPLVPGHRRLRLAAAA